MDTELIANQTMSLENIETISSSETENKIVYSSWFKRAAAYLIDSSFVWATIFLGYFIGSLGKGTINEGILLGVAATLYTGGMIFGFANRCVRMGRTGQSIGRNAIGCSLLSDETNQPIGVWNAIVREFAHMVDILTFGIGYLFPLWDRKGQTLGDKLMKTITIDKSGK